MLPTLRAAFFERSFFRTEILKKEICMFEVTPMFGAAGYALLYLLFGGGLGGALLIFIIARMLGR